MALEPAFDNIDDLVPANPADNDPVDEGDDHLRGIKKALQGNVTGDATITRFMIGDGLTIVGEASVNGQDVIGPNDTSALRFAIRNAANDANRAAFRVDTAGKLFLDNKGPGQDVEILGRNALDDTDLSMALFSPEGAAVLSFNGDPRYTTTATGGKVFGGALDLDNGLVDANTTFSLWSAVGGYQTRVNSGGGEVLIRQTASDGLGEKTWLQLSRDGGVQLNFNDARKLNTISAGIQVSADGERPFIELRDLAEGATNTFLFGETSTSTLQARGDLFLRVGAGTAALQAVFGGNTTLYGNAAPRIVALGVADANSGGTIQDGDGTAQPVGFNRAPRVDTTVSRALAITDNGKCLRLVGNISITLNTGIFGNGDQVNFVNASGTTTFVAGAGATLHWYQGGSLATGNRTFDVYSACSIWWTNGTTAVIYGNGLS